MPKLASHRGWSSRISLRAPSIALALVVVLVRFLVTTAPAEAQSFTLLYSFKGGTDGATPVADLILDGAGNLYGTSLYGGTFGNGTVFKLDTTGTETVLHSFAGGADGSGPQAGLLLDAAGNLYGTTYYGGGVPTCDCGTVFKLDTTGTETVLHSFSGADGAGPRAGLLRDAAGNLYGTTYYGGVFDYGTVFKLDTTGTETVLHSFTGGNDGGGPCSGLLRDAAGNLYGTTLFGGLAGSGTVFKLDTTGTETVLHNFLDSPDGRYPFAGLVGDARNLYGTTQYGGIHGKGAVFKLDKAGRGGVIWSFRGTDGATPSAGLILDQFGNLYGTTYDGGGADWGVVFKLPRNGNWTLGHGFHGGRSDGKNPQAGLVRDAAGNLYSTTSTGGAFNAGTVFKLGPRIEMVQKQD